MLMQLPTPLDCISSAPRWPPSQAPASRPMPSSSVVSTTGVHRRIGLAELDQARVAGIGHVGDLAHAELAQRPMDRLRPTAHRPSSARPRPPI